MQDGFNWSKYAGKTWGTYFGPVWVFPDGTVWPDKSMITEEAVCYWAARLDECAHPVLKARYAGLVWDFKNILKEKQNLRELPKIIINNCLVISKNHLHKYPHEELIKLKWALETALSVKDENIAKDILREMFNRNGFGGNISIIEFLLKNKKAPLIPEQKNQLITELRSYSESRCFSTAMQSAVILANYHRSKDNEKEAKQSILKYINNVLENSTVEQPLRWKFILEEALSLTRKYGLGDDIVNQVECELRLICDNIWKDMKVIKAEAIVDFTEFDLFIDSVLSNKKSSILDVLAINFIPKAQDGKMLFDQLKNDNPISYSINRTLFGPNNITSADLDENDNDLIHTIKQLIIINGVFLKRFIEKCRFCKRITMRTVKKHFSKSHLFKETHNRQLFHGLKSYFKKDYITSIYILVPQLENAIRVLLNESGSAGLEPNKSGGFDERALGALFSMDGLKSILGENLITYFKTIYTHNAGIYLRNLISHGNACDAVFTAEHADLVFHSLIILAALPSLKT